MMVTTVRGKFHEVEGTIMLDEDDPTTAVAEISVAAASLSTGFEARDNHLRSADFFEVEQHPRIVARSTAVEQVGDDTFTVTADVTIRDVTRRVVFDVRFSGFYQGFQGRRMGFEARARINREDWGLGWNVALETRALETSAGGLPALAPVRALSRRVAGPLAAARQHQPPGSVPSYAR